MADLPEGQKLSLLQGAQTCCSPNTSSSAFTDQCPNQILLFGSTKEATCSAFVTSYLHYFPSPTSGLCIPLLSPSSQQNYHFFFLPSLSQPQGETHTPPFTLSTTQQIAFHHGTQNSIFFYLSVSLSPFKLTRGKDQCLFWNKAPEKQLLRKCMLTFVSSQMMNHVPDETCGRKDGRCGRRGRIQEEERNYESEKLEEQVRNYISRYRIS